MHHPRAMGVVNALSVPYMHEHMGQRFMNAKQRAVGVGRNAIGGVSRAMILVWRAVSAGRTAVNGVGDLGHVMGDCECKTRGCEYVAEDREHGTDDHGRGVEGYGYGADGHEHRTEGCEQGVGGV